VEEVRTERLIGTRPLLRDADELAPIMPWDMTPAQTRALLVRDMDHWKRHRFGVWVLRWNGVVVGRAGLHREGEEVALDYLIAPECWGQGLATEIAREALRCAFEVLELPSVIAETEVGNTASRTVMERCGFVYEAEVERAGLPHVRYRVMMRP
jgi:RimJ/RimL family protein N-acetyltransferase